METSTKYPTPDTQTNAGNAARGIDQAGAGVHKTIDKLADAAHPAVDALTSSAHRVVDKATNVANQTADTLATKGAQLNDAQAQLVNNCRDYVRTNPLTSLGFAIAAGFLLSRIVSSR